MRSSWNRKYIGAGFLSAFAGLGLTISGLESDAFAFSENPMMEVVSSVDFDRGTDDKKFLENLTKRTDVSKELARKASSTFKEILSDGGKLDEAASEALMDAYPKYRSTLDQVLDEQTPDSMASLAKFTNSDNKFLAADASFYLGRAYLLDRNHEDAEVSLKKILKDYKQYSFRGTETHYYLGTAQAGLLKTDKAIENLVTFLQNSQNSPQRLVAGAYSQVVKLQNIRKGSLQDASNRMSYSQRKLEQSDSDKGTQTEQKKVVSILNKLIKEAEKKECSKCKGGKKGSKKQSQKQGQKPGQKKGSKPGKSGGKSNIMAGKATRQVYNGKVGLWAKLRDRQRDTANSGVKDKLPAEHRKLIEKYFKKMSEGERLDK